MVANIIHCLRLSKCLLNSDCEVDTFFLHPSESKALIKPSRGLWSYLPKSFLEYGSHLWVPKETLSLSLSLCWWLEGHRSRIGAYVWSFYKWSVRMPLIDLSLTPTNLLGSSGDPQYLLRQEGGKGMLIPDPRLPRAVPLPVAIKPQLK